MTPSELRNSSSSVSLRLLALLGAPPLYTVDALPRFRDCRGGPVVIIVAGFCLLRMRAVAAARGEGESNSALTNGSSSSSSSPSSSSSNSSAIKGRAAVRDGGRVLRGVGAGSGDSGGRLSNLLCADVLRFRRGGVGGRGTCVTSSGSGRGGDCGSASSASSGPWTITAGT